MSAKNVISLYMCGAGLELLYTNEVCTGPLQMPFGICPTSLLCAGPGHRMVPPPTTVSPL